MIARLMRRTRPADALLALAVCLVIAAAGWLGWQVYEENEVRAARAAAADAAKRNLVSVLSYDYRTIDDDTAEAGALLTGQFASDFKSLMTQVVSASAKAKKIVTNASVSGVSVVAADRSSVDVLAFVNQTTTQKGEKEPKLDLSRVLVTMKSVDGAWRISALQPL